MKLHILGASQLALALLLGAGYRIGTSGNATLTDQ